MMFCHSVERRSIRIPLHISLCFWSNVFVRAFNLRSNRARPNNTQSDGVYIYKNRSFSLSFCINMAGTNLLNQARHAEWINLSANTPFKEDDQCKECDFFSPFMVLNDTELVVARYDWPIENKTSIFKYNAITNKWTNLCTFGLEGAGREGWTGSFKTIPSENKLYFFTADCNDRGDSFISVISLDLSTNQLTTKIDRYRYTNESVYLVHLHPIFVNGICHLFIQYELLNNGDGMFGQLIHLSLGEDCGVVSEHHKFTIDEMLEALVEHMIFPLIYVPILNSILFFSDDTAWCIWRFRLDVKEKGWSQVKGIHLPTRIASAIIGIDGNTVLMHNNKNIYLLDVSDENDFKLFESDILIPVPQRGYAKPSLFGMGNALKIEKLVIGWTKRLFGEKEFKHLALPPLYLLQLISHWVLMEEIHWIRVQDNKLMHYAIATKAVSKTHSSMHWDRIMGK